MLQSSYFFHVSTFFKTFQCKNVENDFKNQENTGGNEKRDQKRILQVYLKKHLALLQHYLVMNKF